MLKNVLMASLAFSAVSTAALAEDVKIGVLLGFTGPLESVAADMAAASEHAMSEVNESGAFGLGTLVSVRGDSTCIDAAAATATAERMVSSDGVAAIMGAMCSGATTAVLQNVALAKGIAMVSPSATSPALSTIEDNGLFFRTAPSDARQGEVIAGLLKDKGVQSAALTYTNNDYGKGLADSIATNMEQHGLELTITTAHEDGKGDYSAEVGALAAAGGDVLIVAGYSDQGGKGIIQSALDLGAFETFVLPDGMVGQSLEESIGSAIDGSYGVLPGAEGNSAEVFAGLAETNGFAVGPFAAESYDATALLILAMQAAGSTASADLKEQIMNVANAPGEPIMPGELAKALEILKEGGEIDYVGASAVELIGAGESAGSYREVIMQDGTFDTVQYR